MKVPLTLKTNIETFVYSFTYADGKNRKSLGVL